MRALGTVVLVAMMAAFGLGVYHFLDSQKRVHAAVRQPNQTTGVPLPGTIYLAQDGAIYRFRDGKFTRITSAEGWTQPALSPDGSRLVAVKRAFNSSDLYLLDAAGHVQQRLTHNDAPVVERNHWAFNPRFSADGQSVFYTYDPKDPYNSYRVDLAIFDLVPGAAGPGRQWTYPNEYTGGDVTPVPLRSGALVYSKHSIDPAGKVHSQIWVQARSGSSGLGLTAAEDDCEQPAVSPDGQLLAMVCRHGQPTADVEIATLDLSHYQIGSPQPVVAAGLNAAPSFAADGRQLAYFAPAGGSGPFQLWTVAVPVAPAAATGQSPAPAAPPPAPRQVTQNLGFDSTSAPAWG